MGRHKWLLLLSIFCVFWSCKKQTELIDPEITIDNVYIEFIKSDQVDINYKLSHVGYQATGVSYYKKTNPAAITFVNAIRENDQLKLSLQSLESNTEYVFKVFYKQNNEQKSDTKEYTVKTLSTEMAKFALEVKNTVNYDEKGNFTMEIEGEDLNNLNLSELDIKIDQASITLDYPTLLANKRYKITIKGIVKPIYGNNTIRGLYQGKEILFQSVPFVFDGDSYWLTYQPASLRSGYYASVFNNELYYFYDKQVFKWNDAQQRLSSAGIIQDGTIDANRIGIQFDDQLFFRPVTTTYWPNRNDLSDYYNYPEVYSYTPGTGKWTTYSFKEQQYALGKRVIGNNNYFVHKGELYVSYSMDEDSGAIPNAYLKTDRFIYHYNRSAKRFEEGMRLNTEIINYQFISIDNQLYLTGLVPVYDQGFKVSATFAVFKVDDNFNVKEIYRGGTTAQPLTFMSKSVVSYDHKILIAIAKDDFKLFDPSVQKLYQVFLKNNISNTYLEGFFNYNNKLHLNSNERIYEISIVKGR